VHAYRTGGVTGTAQAERRPSFDVRPQPEAADRPGVDRRGGDAGDGGEDQQVHVRCDRPGGVQSASDGVGSQIGGRGCEDVAGGAEAVRFRLPFERLRHVPRVDPRAAMQPVKDRAVGRAMFFPLSCTG
jgi:hypothetical protein